MHIEDAWDDLDGIPHPYDDDADHIQGAPPPASTNETAAEVLGLYRRLGIPTRGFVALTVGTSPQGVQAEVGRPDSQGVRRPGSLPDVSIVRGGRRMNIEFDPRAQIDTHFRDHLRAMVEAHAARGRRGLPGHPLATTRSVFVGTAPDGRIQEIRHAHYEAHGGRVRQVWDGGVVLPTPLTAAQAVRARVFESLRRAHAELRRQQRRPRRFDGFDELADEMALA
jgi:hypothetical protein